MPSGPERAELLVLGAGLAGLAVARGFGPGAVVLEREARPGGLVRSTRVGEWVFDHALHLLYFGNARSRETVLALPGLHAEPCPPRATVRTAFGVARYPLQVHLAGLEPTMRERCLAGMEAAAIAPPRTPTDYADHLRLSFGDALCETFFLPYNRKMWGRPLETLAPSGFQWNIQRPDLATARAGARGEALAQTAYNADGWYPRPPAGDPLRGIERLAIALAEGADVRVSRTVNRLSLRERRVEVSGPAGVEQFTFGRGCVSTLPLPALAACCDELPRELRDGVRRLSWNRVAMVGLALRGPRPEGDALWDYFSDESLCFHRLIHPQRFDPDLAPADGWSLQAEISEPAESAAISDEERIARVVADARRSGALDEGSTIVHALAWTIDPAYVVFRPGEQEVVARVREFFAANGVHLLGRYGRWEYSSMAQVMGDGLELAATLGGARDGAADPAS